MRGNYKGVSLPEDFVNRINKVIEDKDHGYISIADFVRTALREKLEQYEKTAKK